MYKVLSEINQNDVGKSYSLRGQVTTIKQTSGPTLMILNDGTSNFTLKAFVKPGVRAYPEVEVNDFVKLEAEITRRKDGIEAEVREMHKLEGDQLHEVRDDITKKQDEKVAPAPTEFTIKSKMMESQKDRFIKVATIIRKAVMEGRPIIMRHNADCDGYSAGLTMERAILALMDEVTNGDLIAQYQNYKRAPSKAPFYEYEDSVKDLSFWLRDKVKNGAKAPLIIITDNGSTEEDILAMKQMLLYDAQIVVVDHHYPGEVVDGKVAVDEHILAHINPYLTGFDSNVCTGMLGYELARFIHPQNKNSVFIPAMAAILDHCDCPEKDQYIEAAKKEGFTEEYLANLGEIVDMQSHYLRFMEAREFVDDLYGNNMEAQKRIVEMLTPELEKRYAAVEKVAKHYAVAEDFGPFILVQFDGEKGTYRGGYPAIGKSTNHIHRTFQEELDKPVITTTYGSTFMTVRAADEIKGFSVPEFAKSIMERMPHTNADGGGHERAGSVKFVEYAREDILNDFKTYLEGIAKKQ